MSAAGVRCGRRPPSGHRSRWCARGEGREQAADQAVKTARPRAKATTDPSRLMELTRGRFQKKADADAQGQRCQNKSNEAAADAEQKGLDKRLTHNIGCSGAEREPNRDFAAAANHTHQHSPARLAHAITIPPTRRRKECVPAGAPAPPCSLQASERRDECAAAERRWKIPHDFCARTLRPAAPARG